MRNLLLSLFVCCSLNGTPPEFFVLTMPKGGTSMVNQALRLLSNRGTDSQPKKDVAVLRTDFAKVPYENFAIPANQSLDAGVFIFHHFIASPLYKKLYIERANMIPVAHIRDLRDVLVANVYDKWENIGSYIGHDKNFDTRLLHAIRYPECLDQHDTLLNAKHALFWLKNKRTLIVRFEDLVGSQGGGSDHIQRQTLIRMAKHLRLNPSAQTLNHIQDTLFGSTPTFRKGQIGEWVTHFKPVHKEAFKEKFGDLLIQFGYEEDNSW